MILEIDIGFGFTPVACLENVSETDTAQTIPTTVRTNNGWRTSRPVSQTKTISIDGLIPKDVGLLSYNELADIKRQAIPLSWRIDTDEGFGYITQLVLTGNVDGDVAFSAEIQTTGIPNPGNIPAGYSVEWINAPYDPANCAGAQFQVIGGGPYVDTQFYFEITSSGGGTPITGNAPITTVPAITSRNICSLPDGIITVSVYLENPDGRGPTVFDTTTLTPAPVIPISISIGDPSPLSVVGDGTNSATFLITYTNADILLLDPTDITLNTTGTASAGGVAVAGAGTTERTITLSDVTGFGTIELDIEFGTATNASGAVAPAAISGTDLVVSAPPPTGYSVAWVDDPINDNNTFFDIIGAQIGDQWDAAITSSGGGSPITFSQQTVDANPDQIPVDVSSLPNGILNINLTITRNGTSGAAVSDQTTKNT